MILLVVLTGGPALADVTPPAYDAETYCKATTAMFSNAQMFMDGCRDAERKAKDQMGNVWHVLSDGEKKACISQAGIIGGGSYQGLVGCAGTLIMMKVIDGKLHVTP